MIDSYYIVEAPKWYVWVATVLGLAGIWWGFGVVGQFENSDPLTCIDLHAGGVF